jgi:hypothetical protein
LLSGNENGVADAVVHHRASAFRQWLVDSQGAFSVLRTAFGDSEMQNGRRKGRASSSLLPAAICLSLLRMFTCRLAPAACIYSALSLIPHASSSHANTR